MQSFIRTKRPIKERFVSRCMFLKNDMKTNNPRNNTQVKSRTRKAVVTHPRLTMYRTNICGFLFSHNDSHNKETRKEKKKLTLTRRIYHK